MKKVLTVDYLHDNYILRDHTFYGISIIPGVVYLDVVLRAVKTIIAKKFSVSKILFIQPLTTSEKFNRKLEITFIESKSALYEVSIRSKKMNREGKLFGAWNNHMSCRLNEEIEQRDFPNFDLNDFIENSKGTFGMDEVYTKMQTIDICHGEFMETRGKLYQNNDEELMQLKLSSLAEGYRSQFEIHPAFLDSATLAGSSFKLNVGDEVRTNGVPYIPFSVDKFMCFKEFSETMYVYSKRQPLPVDSLPEIINNDIWVYNERGEIIAYFENLVSKRVRQPELIKNLILESKPVDNKVSSEKLNIWKEEFNQEDDIKTNIITYLKNAIGVKIDKDASELDEHVGFYDLGLDSVTIQSLMGELEAICTHDFDPTLPFEYQTINDLADFLVLNESEHFSVEKTGIKQVSQSKSQAYDISPLVQTIIDKKTYESTFTGKEHFFVDHQILGEKMLPGVAFAEMALEAGENYFDSANVQLINIRWLVAIKIKEQAVKALIKLVEDPRGVTFEIVSAKDGEVYCKGLLSETAKVETRSLDLEELKNKEFDSIEKNEFYETLNAKGFEYGKTFQGVQKLFYSQTETLARIKLSVEDDPFTLSPGATDSALQACIGLVIQSDTGRLSIPYGVKTIQAYKALPNEIWAYVKKNDRKGTIKSYNISILDVTGEVLAEFKEFVALELPSDQKEEVTASKETNSTPVVPENKPKHVKLVVNHDPINDAIAIVGLSGRYPQADNMDEFWENLKTGKNSVTRIPYERQELKLNKELYDWGGFLNDVYKFDPLFFQFAPRLAKKMDPQGRLFLEESWKALEDAGYPPSKIDKSEHVGVFAGVFWTDYQLHQTEKRDEQIYPVSYVSLVPNAVSSCFGFRGPSIGVDAQCSSSLMAVHLACNSIRYGDSTMAIAGGVNLTLHPCKYEFLKDSMFLSSKGKCESFGEGGDGYVPGEGVGVIVLKSLSKAEADGDRIYGVIKGSAINHDGKSSGFTVPNPHAQSEVVATAINRANIDPEDISYIEAHGTGTKLGDPIEVSGLSKVFPDDKPQFCRIGSIKSNIGHCEAAAGIAGITKVLLQLKHKQLVPSLHSKTLNPKIQFEKTAFKVQQDFEPWETENDKLRVAGINSFGAGGSNGHVVIEEYRAKEKVVYESDGPEIIILSAKNKDRLKDQVVNLKKHLIENSTVSLSEVAYTLLVAREEMRERFAVVVENKQALIEKLAAFENGEENNSYRGNIKNAKKVKLPNGYSAEEYVTKCFGNKKYEILAQLWTNGIKVNWLKRYGEIKPNKISLPHYPFARETHTIFDFDDKEIAKKVKIEKEIKQSVAKSVVRSVSNKNVLAHKWVQKEINGEEVDNQENQQLIIVVGGIITLGEKIKEQLVAEVEVLNDEKQFLDQFLKIVGERLKQKEGINITVVYENESFLDVAFVAGVLDSISELHSKVRSKVIGVESLSISNFDNIVSLLENERGGINSEVRYFNDTREVRKFESIDLKDISESNLNIKESGTYLFLGEMGMLEKRLAKDLQDSKNVKIVGVNANHCDFSVKEEWVTVFDQIEKRYPKIDGIITCRVFMKNRNEANSLFYEKRNGIRNIEQLVKTKKPDFLVFLSELEKGNKYTLINNASTFFINNYAEHCMRSKTINTEVLSFNVIREKEWRKSVKDSASFTAYNTTINNSEFGELLKSKHNLSLPFMDEI